MVASVAGTIERVNKLVTVRALRTRSVLTRFTPILRTIEIAHRYNPEVGDLVVGRITEVCIQKAGGRMTLMFLARQT